MQTKTNLVTLGVNREEKLFCSERDAGIFFLKKENRARSFGQFKKHALFKARGQSPCFSYPGLARAFKSPGSADLFNFGGVSVGWPSDLLCYLPVYERAKMQPVYALIVALTDFLSLFCIKQML